MEQAAGLVRVLPVPDRCTAGSLTITDRECLGAIHILSTAEGASCVLHWRYTAYRGVVGLVSADGRDDVKVEKGQSGRDRAAGHVRYHGECHPVVHHQPGCCLRGNLPAHSLVAGHYRYRRCRTRKNSVLVDIACDCLFLADSCLYCFLHSGTESGRRLSVQ